MSQSLEEDDTVLKDLVSRTLLNNGSLGKLQAELRAGVFLALEEEFKDRDVPLCNKRTQELLASSAGSLAASLVHDFLTCLGLDFSLSVYGPESNLEAGLWNLLNRQELVQRLSLGQDKEPSVPVLLWQCREQQLLAARDSDGASQQRLATKDTTARGPAATKDDKAAPLKNNRLNNNKPNDSDDNITSQNRDNVRNTNDNHSLSHTINNNKISNNQSKSGLPEVSTANNNLPVVSKAGNSSTVGSEQNTTTAKGCNVDARARAASTPSPVASSVASSSVTSKASVSVAKTAPSNAASSTEKTVTSKAGATSGIGNTISSSKSSDTRTTLTSSSSGSLASNTAKSANINTSSEGSPSSKNTPATKIAKPNVKGTTPSDASAKLTSGNDAATLASNSKKAGESSTRKATGSRQREAAVVHPPENILSAAPPDTRADSADSSSSASEGDLQRLASSVIKSAAAPPLGRPRQPLPPSGGAKPANRAPKTGVDQAADEPEYDEDFSSSSTWSTESKSNEDEAASSHAADKEGDPVSGGEDKGSQEDRQGAQDKLNSKLRLKTAEDSDPLETEEDISIGDFSTSESVSGREETEDLSAPPSRSAVVDYEEAL